MDLKSLLEHLQSNPAQRKPGQFTTAEAAKAWGMENKKAKAQLMKLFDDGVVEPDPSVEMVNIYGSTQTVKGWRIKDVETA